MNSFKKFLFAGFMFAALSCVLSADELVKPLLDQGLRLYARKDYRGAATYLGQVIDINPNHNQARYYLIYSLALSGNPEAAYEHSKILAQKAPEDKTYAELVKLMQAEVKRTSISKAKAKIESKLIPQEVVFGGYKSRGSGVMSEPRMSTHTYDIRPERPKTPVELAIAKMDEGSAEEAAVMFKKILEKEPSNPEALHNLGVIQFSAGNYSLAIDYFNKAVKANPKSFQSLFLLGDAYRAQENFAKAEENLRKALKIRYDLFAEANLANVCLHQNKLDEAEKMFNKIITSEPNSEDALVGLAHIKYLRGYNDEASELINKAFANSSPSPEAHYIRSKILLEGKLAADAAEEAGIALRMAPANTKYRLAYAKALLQNYDMQAAINEAGQMASENPNNIEAKLILAEALMLSGAEADANEHITFIEKTAKHPQASRLKAIAAFKQGKNKEAKALFEEYVRRSDGGPKAALEYAEFLETLKLPDDAKQVYKAIIEQHGKTPYAARAKDALSRMGGEAVNENDSDSENDSEAAQPSQPANQGGDPNMRPGKVKF